MEKSDSLVLKGIAICAMLCHHLFICVPKTIDTSFSDFAIYLGQIGKFCVSLFVLVSGYGMAYCYSKDIEMHNEAKGLAVRIGCLCKRLFHFYLNYWFIFLIFVPIGVLVFNRPLSASYGENLNTYKHLVYDLLGIKGFRSYNETWWFIKLILILYLLSPVLYDLTRKVPFSCLASTLLLSFVSRYMPFHCFSVDVYCVSFVVGMALCLYGNKIAQLEKYRGSIQGVCLSLAFIICGMIMRNGNVSFLRGTHADVFISLGLALIVVVIRIPAPISSAFAFLGKHSANIFMFHTFIYHRWFPHIVYCIDNSFLTFLVLLAICIPISMLIEQLKGWVGIKSVQSAVDNIINKYVYSV